MIFSKVKDYFTALNGKSNGSTDEKNNAIKSRNTAINQANAQSEEKVAAAKAKATAMIEAENAAITENNAVKTENIGLDITDDIQDTVGAGVKTAQIAGVADDVHDTVKEVGNVTDVMTDAAVSTNVLTNTFGNLGTKMTGVFSTIGTVLSSAVFWEVTAAVTALGIAFYAAYKSYKAFDDKLEATNTSTSEYQDTKSDLESLNSELDITKEKLEELEGKKSLTLTEEEELEKLRQENAELERQVKLKEKAAEAQQKEAEKNALDTLSLEKTKNLAKPGSYGQNPYQKTDIITASQDEIDRLKEAKAEREKLVKEYNETGDTSVNMKIESLDKEVATIEEGLTENLANLQVLQSALADATTTEGKKAYDIITQVIDSYNNIDLSPAEQLDNFFSGTNKAKLFKEELENAAKSGKDLGKVLDDMGLSISDLGLEGEEGLSALEKYFNNIQTSAEKTKKSIDSIDGSFKSVQDAFESTNRDSEWTSMAENFTQLKDLYKKGKIGTDDFKTAVQYLSPKTIDANSTTFDAEAYVKAYEKYKKKIKRYFDEENPTDSAIRAQNDLIKAGLGKKKGEEIFWTEKFKSSADAADAFGVSVEAAEAILKNLETYGAEFGDNFTWSAEQAESYKASLEGIESVYEQLEDGRAKDRLEKLKKGFKKEYAAYEDGLSELSEEQVVKITFEYDLSEIALQIQELQEQANASDDNSDWAALNVANKKYREKREKQTGYNEKTGDKGYKKSYKTIKNLQDSLRGKTDEQKAAIQEEIDTVYDLQNAFQDMYADGKVDSWEDFLKTDEAQEMFDEILESTDITKERLEELFNIDLNGDGKINISADTSEYEEEVNKVTREEIEPKIVSIVGKDQASGVVAIWERLKTHDKFTKLTAEDQANYVIEIWNALSPEEKRAIINGEDNASEILDEIEQREIEDKSFKVELKDFATDKLKSIKQWLNKLKDKVIEVTTKKKTVTDVGGTSGRSDGADARKTAEERGAGANGSFHPAYAKGTGTDVDIKKDQDALVNEVGEEGLVRDGKLYKIRGGAHIEHLKRGDIIFNHKQMEELKRKGYVTSNGGRGKLIGSSFANGTLGVVKNLSAYNKEDEKGGMPKIGYSGSGSSGNSKSSGKSNTKKSGSGNNNTDDKTDKKLEAFNKYIEKLFDWVEIRLTRLQAKTDKWTTAAENAVDLSKKATYYKKAIESTGTELDVNSAAATKYYDQAKKVGKYAASKGIVSSKWVANILNLMKTGKLVISQYSENEQTVISAMQEWYDKSVDCKTAVSDLTDSLQDLYTEMLNIPNVKAEEKIDKINDTLDILDARYENLKTASSKNANIDSQNKQQANINSQYQAAYTETKKALKSAKAAVDSQKDNALKGLSTTDKKKIVTKVKSGEKIEILDGWTKKTKDAVAKYNAALEANYTASVNAKKATEEYTTTLRENAKEKFDNIQQEYEYKIQIIDYKNEDVDNRISEIEAAGAKANISYYKAQKGYEADRLKNLQAEQKALEESLKGIEEGTDEWYDAKDAIQQVKNETSDCVEATYELNNSITEAYDNLFESIHDEINRIMDEQSFLRGLFEHEDKTDTDTGNFTEAGYANLASLTASYYAALENQKNAKAAVEELQAMIDKNILSNGKRIYNSFDELEAAREEYYDTWRDDIQATYDLESEIVDAMKEQYQAQLDMLQELIDKKKEALEKEKDLYDYQNTLNEKTKNIATLQKQKAAYAGDTSQEGMAKLQKLAKELEEAQKDLQETEYERYISDQEDMLDKLYDEYEELVEKKLDDFYALLKEGIQTGESNATTANGYLEGIMNTYSYNAENGKLVTSNNAISTNVATIVTQLERIETTSSGILEKPTENGSGSGSGNNSNSGGSTNNTNNSNNTAATNFKTFSTTDLLNQVKLTPKLGTIAGQVQSTSSSSSTGKVSGIKHTLKEGMIGSAVKTLQKGLNAIMKSGLTVDGKFGSKTTSALKKFQKKYKLTQNGILDSKTKSKFKSLGYAKGTKRVPEDGIYPTQELGSELFYRDSDGAIFTPLGENDMVFSHKMSENLWNLAQLDPEIFKTDYANMVPKAQAMNNIDYGGVQFNFEFTGVNDANSLVHTIQTDKKLQKTIQSITVDRLGGAGRLSMKKY